MKILQHNSIASNTLAATFNKGKRQMTHYVSTEDINCYGYKLRNQGMNQEEYRNNPVVLWAHEISGGFFEKSPAPGDLIVGKNISLTINNDGIEAVTEFADTDLGNEVMTLNMDGFLNAWSVRWDFLNDADTDISMIGDIPLVLNWKVKEYSSCVIPGNPYATNKLQQALSLVKTPMLKNLFGNQLMVAKFNEELAGLKLGYDTKLTEIETKLSDSGITKKDLQDIRAEFKSLHNEFKKYTTDKLLQLAFNNLTLKENLHSFILSKISGEAEKVIRKYIGKVD